jgi:hypothetical protein
VVASARRVTRPLLSGDGSCLFPAKWPPDTASNVNCCARAELGVATRIVLLELARREVHAQNTMKLPFQQSVRVAPGVRFHADKRDVRATLRARRIDPIASRRARRAAGGVSGTTPSATYYTTSSSLSRRGVGYLVVLVAVVASFGWFALRF